MVQEMVLALLRCRSNGCWLFVLEYICLLRFNIAPQQEFATCMCTFFLLGSNTSALLKKLLNCCCN